MTVDKNFKKELTQSNKESDRLKAYALKAQNNKPIQFRDKDFLNKYYRNEDASLNLPDFNSGHIPTLDELPEEEEMNKLERKKKSSLKPKRKVIKKCKCK